MYIMGRRAWVGDYVLQRALFFHVSMDQAIWVTFLRLTECACDGPAIIHTCPCTSRRAHARISSAIHHPIILSSP
ncbi:uncharacterized protein YALI1_F20145g [Yarrowia lipolytica]|uniref:Uncharacterized protein n=1 Tax=Yarrowia lipolytica TaxID=4952 RepID=A0A1D8NNH9_YARLL|nr:hypothetical protein YALI1_F20145g [Yarrowia lipolytica]